jgi:uncharacterized MAPEG superfamily protein
MEPYVVMILGYALWMYVLLLGIVVVRFRATQRGLSVTKFTPTGGELDAIGGRVCRAHANCYENFGPLLAIVLAAYVTGQGAELNTLAYGFLLLRMAQSVTHIFSGTPKMMGVRGLFFMAQVGIQVYWIFGLLM